MRALYCFVNYYPFLRSAKMLISQPLLLQDFPIIDLYPYVLHRVILAFRCAPNLLLPFGALLCVLALSGCVQVENLSGSWHRLQYSWPFLRGPTEWGGISHHNFSLINAFPSIRSCQSLSIHSEASFGSKVLKTYLFSKTLLYINVEGYTMKSIDVSLTASTRPPQLWHLLSYRRMEKQILLSLQVKE